MDEIDILKDILSYRTGSQRLYNYNIIEIRNPEARQLFTQLRDDETRGIERLQQRIERLEISPGIISRIFSNRQKQ